MTEAKDWLGRKPDQPSPERLCAARYAPATTLEDAEDVIGRDPALAALLLGEALPLILDAYWMAQVRQRPRRKECLDHLQQDDPTAASLMRVALGCGTVRERLDAAGALSQRLMGVRGTFAWTSEREPVPDPDASPRSVT
jgi:hypothetical protein